MKVIFPFSGSSIGGSQLSAITIHNFLKKNNISSTFVTHKDGNFTKYLKKNNIQFDYLSLKYLPGENPNKFLIIFMIFINFYKIFKYLKNNNVEVVHGNNLSINLAWSIPTLIAKKKFIWHQRQPLSNSYYWKLINYMSSFVIANSKFVYDTLPTKVYKKKKIYNSFSNIKIYNKFESKNYLLNKYKINNKTCILGFVGRVEQSKDVLYTIKILNNLSTSKKFHFFIIGQQNKSYLKEINTFIKKSHIKNNITFISFEKNINKFISGIDILISSSRNEAFGRILIEAMLQKTLLICSNQGAHPELINDGFNGFLFNKSDPNELTNILNNLFELNNINQKIINNAYNYAYNNFYNDNGLLEIIDIYNMDI